MNRTALRDNVSLRGLPAAVRYALPVVLSVAAVALRVSAGPWLGDHPVMSGFLLPTIVSAWIGGLGPGCCRPA